MSDDFYGSGKIVVSQVGFVTSYRGEYWADVPEAGNVYVQVWITYEATSDGFMYNPFDWAAYNDGVAVDNWAFVTNGPKPELSSGNLPAGRRAEGWLVLEVPVSGQLLLSYQDDMFGTSGPAFEILLRD